MRLGLTKTTPGSGDSGGVGQHAQATIDLGEVTTRDIRGGFVADSELESGRAPIYDVNRLPGFDGSDRRLYILGNHVTTVKHTTSHCDTIQDEKIGSRSKRIDILYFPSLGSHLTI